MSEAGYLIKVFIVLVTRRFFPSKFRSNQYDDIRTKVQIKENNRNAILNFASF